MNVDVMRILPNEREGVITPSTWQRSCIWTITATVVGIAVNLGWGPSVSYSQDGPTLRYPWEKKALGTMGWVAQDYEDSQGCTKVSRSDEKGHGGRHSLKMRMDLIGKHKHKSTGEAWVDWQDDPPPGERIPADMLNRTITVWVYAPRGSRGERGKPNGFQVFVKDENWKSQYGTWKNVREGEWSQISLTVSTDKPRGGYVDQGFNPKRIIAMGVKMGIGGRSSAKFKGAVYIDTVKW